MRRNSNGWKDWSAKNGGGFQRTNFRLQPLLSPERGLPRNINDWPDWGDKKDGDFHRTKFVLLNILIGEG